MGTIIGTPAFMSPEQAMGKLNELGPTSDVFSLGATMYFLLTGQAPFTNQRMEIVLIQIEQGDFPPPREIRPKVPAALEAICLKAMARKPRDRYRSPKELALDVERCLADEAVSAYFEPVRVKAGRWMRKHPALVTAACVTILLSLIGSATVLNVVSKSNRQLADANNELTTANDLAQRAKQEAQGIADELAQSNEQLKIANQGERAAKQEAQLTTKTLEILNENLRSANAAERQATEQADTKRKEAELAHQRAQEAREQARAVTGYLVDAFRSPDPAMDGRVITVAEVLDRAIAELDSHLQDDPLVTASVADAMGQTYRGLGLYDRAIELLLRARDTRRKILGLTHEDSLQSTSNLAEAYLGAGDFDKAMPLFKTSYQVWKEQLGQNDPITLEGMNDLATAYRLAGQLPMALTFSEGALDIMKEQLGLDDRKTLVAMDNLATTYRAAKRLPEAISLFEEALRRAKASLGHDNVQTVQATNNLAAAYQDNGQLAEAVSLFEQTLKLDRKNLGPDHPNTLKSMGNLATSYFNSGEEQKALPLLKDAFDLTKAKLGADHPYTLKAMSNLAAGYFEVGQRVKAMALLENGFELTWAKLGVNHIDTRKTLDNIVATFQETNEIEILLPHLERTLGVVALKLGDDDPTVHKLIKGIATQYLLAEQHDKAIQMFERLLMRTQQGEDPLFAAKLAVVADELLEYQQYEAAENYCRECILIFQEKAPDHWMLPAAKSMLGKALAGQKEFEEAEEMLLAGYKGLSKSAESETARNLAESVERLIDFYRMRCQPDEVAEWVRVSENLRNR